MLLELVFFSQFCFFNVPNICSFNVMFVFRCEFKGCNIRFRALDNLEYHKKCHVSGGNSFACPECGMTLVNWGTIANHLWRIHKNDMELHACDQCPFR